jgi:exonuclease SbcC
MKILKIRTLNVNSLKGENVVDLEKMLGGDGVFAIVGPTGSGKSTLLKAVLCSLFGELPGGDVKEMMTRGTGEMECETTFEVDGKRYRAKYHLHRANKKPQGNFQTPEMELADAKTNEILISPKIKEVKSEIEKITGFDVKRFTRAVMLEQGAFDAFIKAKENERTALLEKMAGIDIYRKISQKVYERHGEKKREIEDLETEIATLEKELMDPKRKKNLETRKERLETGITRLEHYIETLDKTIEKAQDAQRAQEKLVSKRQKFKSAINVCKQERENFERLQKAQKAKEIDGAHRDFKNAVANEENYNKRLSEATKNKQEAKKALEKAKKKLTCIQSVLDKIAIDKDALTKRKGLLEEIERLLDKYKKEREELQTAQNEANEAQNAMQAAQKELENLEKRWRESLFARERKKLKEGEPCPLCGATHHPMAQAHEPEEAQTTSEEEVKKLREKVNDLIAESGKKQGAWTSKREQVKNTQVELQSKMKKANIEADLEDPQGAIRVVNEEIKKTVKQINRYDKTIAAKNKAENRVSKAEGQWQETINVLKNLEEEGNTKKYTDVRQKAERLFQDKLKEKGFADQTAFEEALLEEEAFKELESHCQEIEDELREAKRRYADAKKEWQKAKNDYLDKTDLEQIMKLSEKRKKQETKARGYIGKLKTLLEENDKREKGINEKKEQKEEMIKANAALDKLNEMIGSSSGDKYAKFANGVTLSRLLALANRHLEHLNGRYRLVRTDDESLSFVIEDSYFLNETRPIETLSGGESFLVSLAMALGLSDLVRGRAAIESLFIDEGFGTLDGETLQAVLDTLGRLERDGRTVGVISHVEALKENIAKKIVVEPVKNGESRLVVGESVFTIS